MPEQSWQTDKTAKALISQENLDSWPLLPTSSLGIGLARQQHPAAMTWKA
jgi:hypothetical protein